MRGRIGRVAAYVLVLVAVVYGLNQLQARDSARLAKVEHRDALRLAAVIQSTDRKITQAQLSACARGNRLRGSVNGDTKILQLFMQAVVKATKAKPGKKAQARALFYQELAANLHLAATVDCRKAVG